MRAQNRTLPFTRQRADFSFNLHLTKTCPIVCSQKIAIFAVLNYSYINFLYRRKLRGTPISPERFFGTSRIFSNAAANSKAVGGW